MKLSIKQRVYEIVLELTTSEHDTLLACMKELHDMSALMRDVENCNAESEKIVKDIQHWFFCLRRDCGQ